tara:strand:+ start:1264 stop:1518 length:255 start_codon:yes stop_codon:yes gene_type:complete
MLIEGLSNITYVNGILRVQCTMVDPSGKEVNSGTLEIPGTNLNAVLNGLINSAKAIEDKLSTLQEESNNSSGKKEDKKNKKSKK